MSGVSEEPPPPTPSEPPHPHPHPPQAPSHPHHMHSGAMSSPESSHKWGSGHTLMDEGESSEQNRGEGNNPLHGEWCRVAAECLHGYLFIILDNVFDIISCCMVFFSVSNGYKYMPSDQSLLYRNNLSEFQVLLTSYDEWWNITKIAPLINTRVPALMFYFFI